ncbi:hypothetical protein [Paenibacillus sp. EPM92]|uniref:hypothetical protein n=1 Tax=Paenibacillus sp. EPM92 TaxID=1561195 RepID=UPI001915637D|nr:hypothetical protein [Paenibacillus sp. EPM92]
MNYLKWSIVAVLFIANVGVVVFGKKHFESKASAAAGHDQTHAVSVGQAVYEHMP